MKSLRGELRQQENLARYTSWRVGGNARQTYRPADLEDLKVFLNTLPENETLIWLGLGSNVLIRDGGILGTVIITQGKLNKIEHLAPNLIRVEAGVTCAKMAKYCVKLGFLDSAFFAGVPGTMGGALAMNAGAFGGETWRHVVKVETLNNKGQLIIRTPEEFEVKYREVKRPEKEWFVAGHFEFSKSDGENSSTIQDLLHKRNDTQPIGQFSCGSVFRNPPGDYAARLIESAGLKGFRQGNAWVSDKHANFIINGGKATANDIEKLILYVQQQVEKIHGIRLIPEVHIIGEE